MRTTPTTTVRALALLLTWMLCLAPLCAGATGEESGKIQALTISIVMQNPSAFFSPLTLRERDPLSVLNLCYDGLVELDDTERPMPGLASSWEAPVEGGSRWTFHLRPDVTFHNGQPLTAQDVCATLDHIFFTLAQYDEERKNSPLDAEERGVYGNLNAYISGWRALDDSTVEITAARKYYGLLSAMTFPVLPASEVANQCPSGTGPYKIEVYEPGDRILLSSNSKWWNGRPPSVLNVMATIYPDTEKALAAFDAGEVTTTMTRSLSATRYSGSMRSFSIPYRTRQVEMLLMHQKSKMLGDEVVRRAIISAIDRTALTRQVYQNMAVPVTTPIQPGTWLYDESATQDSYDPEGARKLLDDNGWIQNSEGIRSKTVGGDQQVLSLRLFTSEEPGNSVRRSAAELISEMLSEVGIKVTITPYTHQELKGLLQEGNFDLALCGINFDVVPDAGFLLMSGLISNYCRYSSEPMTSLFNDMRKQSVEADYRKSMSAMQHQFVSDAPFMCLYARTGALLTRETFTNVTILRELDLFRGIESW